MSAFSTEINVWFGDSGIPPYLPEATAVQHSTFNSSVMGQLFEVDDNNQVSPKALSNFSYNQERKEFILELPQELRFHNGRKVTTIDFKFSLLRGLFSSKKNFYLLYLKEVVGISASKNYASFEELMNDKVIGIRILDSKRVSITLIRDNPNFIYMFCKGYFHLVPREELDSDLFTWRKLPIGVGPYKVSSIDFEKGVAVLELFNRLKNPLSPTKVNYYFKKRPLGLEPDVLPFEEIATQNLPVYNLYEYQNIESISMFMTNNVNRLGRDQDFRRLIYGLLDREAISAQIRGTLPAYENLPRVFGGNIGKELINRESLKKKYAIIMEDLKKNGLPILCFSPSSGVKTLKPILINMFKLQGIEVTFIDSNDKFPSKEISEKSPLRLTGKIVDFFDPSFLFVSLLDASPYFYQRSLDKHLEELNKEFLSEENKEKRHILTKAISEYVANKAYDIPILEKKRILAFKISKISTLGMQTQPLILKFENIRTVH